MDKERQELLEIYKLHAELADRVSQRREGANKFFISLLISILILFAATLRYGILEIHESVILIAVGILGIVLSISWCITIRSYRQLNTGKFNVLHELEEKLSYPFFKREWELLGEGKNNDRYRKLTVVETIPPIVFFIFFLFLVVAGLYIT